MLIVYIIVHQCLGLQHLSEKVFYLKVFRHLQAVCGSIILFACLGCSTFQVDVVQVIFGCTVVWLYLDVKLKLLKQRHLKKLH